MEGDLKEIMLKVPEKEAGNGSLSQLPN